MRVLFIATRVPYGQMHGHKMGMRTYIRSLQALRHEVTIAAFAVPGDDFKQEDLNAKTYYLKLPNYFTILTNIVRHGLPMRKSINECLYLDDSNFERIREICRIQEIDFIVADMMRTAPYAEATSIPWILDHEDLLSERYRMWATRASGNENILGYLTNYVPRYLRPSVRRVFRMVLKRESELLAVREVYWTNKSICSSLRSLEETESLAARCERRVFCMPVTVPVPKNPANTLGKRPVSAVFTGGLTYQPNLDALRAYIKKVLPAFERQGVQPPRLNVIGASPEPLKVGLGHPSIHFLGYVPDVNEELMKHQVFFAPIVSGTGIKTKVLEAMACGLPVIAFPDAVSGLSAEPMRHYLLAKGPEEAVQCYVLLREDPSLAKRIGAAARHLVVQSYSIEAATEILGSELDRVLATLEPRAQLSRVR